MRLRADVLCNRGEVLAPVFLQRDRVPVIVFLVPIVVPYRRTKVLWCTRVS